MSDSEIHARRRLNQAHDYPSDAASSNLSSSFDLRKAELEDEYNAELEKKRAEFEAELEEKRAYFDELAGRIAALHKLILRYHSL